MTDAVPGDVGDVQQAVDTAEVEERTVVGDVLDGTLEHFAFLHVGHDFITAADGTFIGHGAAADNQVVALAVQFHHLEFQRDVHERCCIGDRLGVQLAAGQEAQYAGDIHHETALDLAEDDALDGLASLVGVLEGGQDFFAAGLFAAEAGFGLAVIEGLVEHVDHVADLDLDFGGFEIFEFLERDTAFAFQTDIQRDAFAIHFDNNALDHAADHRVGIGKGVFQALAEIDIEGFLEGLRGDRKLIRVSEIRHLFVQSPRFCCMRPGHRLLHGLRGL